MATLPLGRLKALNPVRVLLAWARETSCDWRMIFMLASLSGRRTTFLC